jgi:hypothetical protein
MTAYEFRVRVENEIGNSDYSNTIAITTNMEGMVFDIIIFILSVISFNIWINLYYYYLNKKKNKNISQICCNSDE